MFQHILLPTDGSDLSGAAARNGVALAKLVGAKVTGLCVVLEHQVASGLGDVMRGQQDAVAAAESFLAVIAAEARGQRVPHECFYVKAPAIAEEIVKVAAARGCDLICMASHGHRGIAGLLLGSDTADVLTRCKIPVLVYR
jgi:nucleotide-binding universal stress UspA family protein